MLSSDATARVLSLVMHPGPAASDERLGRASESRGLSCTSHLQALVLILRGRLPSEPARRCRRVRVSLPCIDASSGRVCCCAGGSKGAGPRRGRARSVMQGCVSATETDCTSRPRAEFEFAAAQSCMHLSDLSRFIARVLRLGPSAGCFAGWRCAGYRRLQCAGCSQSDWHRCANCARKRQRGDARRPGKRGIRDRTRSQSRIRVRGRA